MVKDQYGNSIKTEVVYLRMNEGAKVAITQQPQTTYTKQGQTASVTVGATGDGLTYTWYIKNAGSSSWGKSSVTTNTYTVTMGEKIKNRQIYCVVKDQYGNTAKTDTVYLYRAVTILEQPQTVYAVEGYLAQTTVTAVGDGLTYTWYVKNAGASYWGKSSITTKTYSVKMSAKIKDRQLYCVITDQYGNKETTDIVYLRAGLVITEQPETAYAAMGETVSIQVKAEGEGLTYTWYVKNAGKNYFGISSVTTDTYTVKMSATSKDRQVYCTVTDKYGNKVASDIVYLREGTAASAQNVNTGSASASGELSNSSEGPAATGDVRLYIYGALAVLSLAGLVAVSGFKGLLKNRWFVIVLCFALLIPVLGPVAMAAEKDKSLHVSTTITVDGQSVTLNATVTYDVEDEYAVEGTNEVVYKQSNVINYNLSAYEKGYYDYGEQDPHYTEVPAPYMERLFGAYLNTNSEEGELEGTKLFNAGASGQVLIGKTTDAASTEALSLIEKNQWIITEISGKLVITGWYDDATAAAVRHLYSLVDGKSDVTLKLPIIGGSNYSHGNMPDFDYGTFLNGMNSDQGAVMLRYNGITEANFTSYKATLAADGWTLYQENALQGYNKQSKYASYVKGSDVIHVQYLPQSLTNTSDIGASVTCEAKRMAGDEIRIILEPVSAMVQLQQDAAYDLSHVGGVAQKEALHVVNLNKNYSDGNDVGALMIYTLADGSFFVWDGGNELDGEQLMKALRNLNKRDDGIVIAGWLLTHWHGDHVGAFDAVASGDYAKELTVETVIYNRVADSYAWRGVNVNESYGAHSVVYKLEEKCKNFKNGDETRLINPHMGQNMQIRNLNVEVLAAGEEDQFPVLFYNDNTSSLIANITYDGLETQNVVMLADGTQEIVKNVIYPLHVKELDCDILMTSHHGLYSMGNDIYYSFIANTGKTEKVAIWNTSAESIKNNNYSYMISKGYSASAAANDCYIGPNKSANDMNRFYTALNKPLRDCVQEDIVADTHMSTLYFPYTVGSAVKTYIGDYRSDYFNSEDMKVAFLAANKFYQTFKDSAKQAKYIETLAAYDADLLVLSQLDQNASDYNGMDCVGILQSKLGYPYAFYAPAWNCDANGGTLGHLVLSRYPIDETLTKTVVLNEGTTADSSNEGRSVAHVVLDVDGLTVDVYAGHFTAAAWTNFKTAFAGADKPVGKYWMIVANTNMVASSASVVDADLGVTGTVDAGLNNGNYEIYLSSGAVATNPEVDTAWAGTSGITGNQYMGNGYTLNVSLSRRVLTENIVLKEFEAPVSVGQWWCHYQASDVYKEQVIDWLQQNRHEIVGLIHVREDVLNDAGAAELAELAGYEYYTYVTSWTRDSTTKIGHLLLSHYPITDGTGKDTDPVVLRDDGLTEEGRAYLHAIVDLSNVYGANYGSVDVYVGENDSVGDSLASQRTALEVAVRANATSGREFMILGFEESHISETYAGKNVKIYNFCVDIEDMCQSIVFSNGLPMSNRVSYGTNTYPVNGESHINISLNSICPYGKVDMVPGVAYTLTVNGASGSGEYESGQTVALNANVDQTGREFMGWTLNSGDVTIEDLTAPSITFTMPAGNVEITANYKDVPVEGKLPNGEKLDLKVLSLPAFRFGNAYNATYASQINQAIIDYDADIIAITQVDNCTTKYNKTDVPGQIAAALEAADYYSYYAPIWVYEENGSLATGAGTVGHMIFSKYEILNAEALLANPSVTTYSADEQRGAARVLVKLDENTTVEVYSVYTGSAASEWATYFTNRNQNWSGDYWLCLGRTGTNTDTIAAYFGQTGGNATVNGKDGNRSMLASKGLTLSNWGYDTKINSLIGNANNPAEAHFADMEVALLGSYGTYYGAYTNGDEYGFYKEGDTVTMTAPSKVGYKFASWVLPEGVTLTGVDVSSETITFTMQPKFLYFGVNYTEAPVTAVTFANGGGTGTMNAVLANRNEAYVLPECTFGAPYAQQFAGWSVNGQIKQAGDTVTLTDAAITLTATWMEIPNSITVATMSTFRFAGDTAFNNNFDAIVAELLSYDTDILALMQVSGGSTTNYGTTNQYEKLKTALAEKYPNAYFAPVWAVPASGVTADATTGKGYVGNVIFSKHPFVGTPEHIYLGTDAELNSNKPTYTEGRGVAHVVINVNGINVDIFATHLEGAANWTVAALKDAVNNANANNPWIAMGSIYGNYTIANALGVQTVNVAFGGQYDVVGSSNVSFFGPKSDSDLKGLLGNGSNVLITGVQLPTPLSVSFNANGGTGSMDAIVTAGSVTLPECTILPPTGKTFAGWSVGGQIKAPGDTIQITEPVTVVATWESYNYPTVAAPVDGDPTNTISMIQWWGVGKAHTPAANAAAYLAQSAYHADVAVLINAEGFDTTSAASFADSAGYAYHYYIQTESNNDSNRVVGHMVLSKYSITPVDVLTLVTDVAGSLNANEGRAFAYVSLDVYGTAVDLVFGENSGTNTGAAHQMILKVEPWAEAIADDRTNPLILAGYNLNNTGDTSFAHMTKSSNSTGAICWGTGFLSANSDSWTPGEVDPAITTVNLPGYVELTIVDQNPNSATYTVTYHANDGSGSTSSATGVAEGTFVLPTSCSFNAPEGMLFAGWSTTANGTAVSRLEITGDVTVYAIWKNAPKTIKVVEFWCNYYTNATRKADIAAYLKNQNYDLVVLTHLNPAEAGSDALAASLAETFGYNNFAYVIEKNADGTASSAVHMLLSKYPLKNKSQVATFTTSDEIRAFGKATATINGTDVDVFYGFFGGNATAQNRTDVETAIQNANTTEQFIFMGGQFATYTTYAGKTVSQYRPGTNSSIVATGGLSMTNADTVSKADISTDIGTVGTISDLSYCELSVAWTEGYTVSFNANGGSGIMGDVAVKQGTYTLPANGFTAPAGHTFKGWSTTANGAVISATTTNITGNTTLYAIWEPISLKVGYFSAYRFNGGYDTATTATEINNKLMALDLDVVVINQVESGTFAYPGHWNNTSDPVGSITAAVKSVYPYYYYASAGKVVDDTAGEYGNLILSKYPIVTADSETISLADGTPFTHNTTNNSYTNTFVEGRPAGRARLNVEGYLVDVYFTHTGDDAAQFTTLAGKIAESQADAWIAMGFLKYADATNDAKTLLGDYNAAFTTDQTVLADAVLTMSGEDKDTTTFTTYNSSSNMYYVTVTVPEQ